jgi:hypothetical protein
MPSIATTLLEVILGRRQELEVDDVLGVVGWGFEGFGSRSEDQKAAL